MAICTALRSLTKLPLREDGTISRKRKTMIFVMFAGESVRKADSERSKRRETSSDILMRIPG